MLKPLIALTCVLALLGSALVRADSPTTAPSAVAASDKEGLKAALGKEIVVFGKVDKAAWSGTGKVMNVTFDGVDRKEFVVVLFEKNKKKFDEAYGGDVAKTLTGAEIRVRGKVEEFKGGLEIKIDGPSQVTITTPASTQPASN
ncbi:MAG: hypothetical protein QM770_08375 [Tepidisphaeraceae bacterium]